MLTGFARFVSWLPLPEAKRQSPYSVSAVLDDNDRPVPSSSAQSVTTRNRRGFPAIGVWCMARTSGPPTDSPSVISGGGPGAASGELPDGDVRVPGRRIQRVQPETDRGGAGSYGEAAGSSEGEGLREGSALVDERKRLVFSRTREAELALFSVYPRNRMQPVCCAISEKYLR
jgi:hypothetical protein